MRDAAARIGGARPTAVNLSWALGRMGRAIVEHRGDPATLHAALIDEATRILVEDREMCHRIGEHGARLIHDGARVLTHCNAGALATGGLGTALAAIYVAVEQESTSKSMPTWIGEQMRKALDTGVFASVPPQ